MDSCRGDAGVDTKFLVRFLVRDDEAQFEKAQKLIKREVAAGRRVFLTSPPPPEGRGFLRTRGAPHEHVHLLIHYPPQVQLSKLLNSLKGVSSRMLRQGRPDIAHRYWRGVLWSPSYFVASCGGAPLAIIRQYVEQQQSPGR
jgi:hypothetical protein